MEIAQNSLFTYKDYKIKTSEKNLPLGLFHQHGTGLILVPTSDLEQVFPPNIIGSEYEKFPVETKQFAGFSWETKWVCHISTGAWCNAPLLKTSEAPRFQGSQKELV